MVVSETSPSRDHAASARDIMAALRQLQAHGEADSPRATMLRVLWLRSDHEDARIATELTHPRDDLVVFHAVVTLANGASASGYAAEALTTDDDPAATIERGETRAIGRALDILGYIISTGEALERSTTSTPEVPESRAPASAPAPTEPPPAAVSEPPASRESPPMVVNALRNVSLRARGTETQPDAGIDPDTGEIIKPEAEPDERVTPPSSSGSGPDADGRESADDLPLADYTWTHFWKWARAHELTTKGNVEKRLGHSIDGRTPADVRAELHDLGIPL